MAAIQVQAQQIKNHSTIRRPDPSLACLAVPERWLKLDHSQWRLTMSWIGIVLVVVGLLLALKVAGFVMKLLMWGLVIVGLYWLLAPALALPTPF